MIVWPRYFAPDERLRRGCQRAAVVVFLVCLFLAVAQIDGTNAALSDVLIVPSR